jgi:hypothetical protein
MSKETIFGSKSTVGTRLATEFLIVAINFLFLEFFTRLLGNGGFRQPGSWCVNPFVHSVMPQIIEINRLYFPQPASDDLFNINHRTTTTYRRTTLNKLKKKKKVFCIKLSSSLENVVKFEIFLLNSIEFLSFFFCLVALHERKIEIFPDDDDVDGINQ